MPRAAPPATADDGSSTAAAPEPSMTSVSTTTVTDPSSVNTESAGVEDAESSQGGKPTQLESGHDLTTEEEALLPGCMAPNTKPARFRALWTICNTGFQGFSQRLSPASSLAMAKWAFFVSSGLP